MISTTVHLITSEYGMLLAEDDKDFEIIIKTEWLPVGIRIGDMVEIEFAVKPRKRKNSNVSYLSKYFEEGV